MTSFQAQSTLVQPSLFLTRKNIRNDAKMLAKSVWAEDQKLSPLLLLSLSNSAEVFSFPFTSTSLPPSLFLFPSPTLPQQVPHTHSKIVIFYLFPPYFTL